MKIGEDQSLCNSWIRIDEIQCHPISIGSNNHYVETFSPCQRSIRDVDVNATSLSVIRWVDGEFWFIRRLTLIIALIRR